MRHPHTVPALGGGRLARYLEMTRDLTGDDYAEAEEEAWEELQMP